MIKLFAMEAKSNVAVAINGRKRENFEVWAKVLVTRDEYLSLLRLGFKLVWEAEIEYKDIQKLIVSSEKEAEDAKMAERFSKRIEKSAKKADTVIDTQDWSIGDTSVVDNSN